MDPVLRERFEERAAILEYCAGYPRAEAERIARRQLGITEQAEQMELGKELRHG